MEPSTTGCSVLNAGSYRLGFLDAWLLMKPSTKPVSVPSQGPRKYRFRAYVPRQPVLLPPLRAARRLLRALLHLRRLPARALRTLERTHALLLLVRRLRLHRARRRAADQLLQLRCRVSAAAAGGKAGGRTLLRQSSMFCACERWSVELMRMELEFGAYCGWTCLVSDGASKKNSQRTDARSWSRDHCGIQCASTATRSVAFVFTLFTFCSAHQCPIAHI
jgi:hypothetical protein